MVGICTSANTENGGLTMLKRRLIYATNFMLKAMGIFFLLLILYCLLADPEKLTRYEALMTFGFSAFVADWIDRRADDGK